MKVLISVTSPEEAVELLDSGVDIIDVKNPAEGSLGAQLPWVTREIVALARSRGIETSAAAGDLPSLPGSAALAACGAAMTGADFIKAGLRGARSFREALAALAAFRRGADLAGSPCRVVAAGYADHRRVDGLPPSDLVLAAREAGCDAVLLDTAVKDGATLFDALPMDELRAFAAAAREAGLIVALAGALGPEHAEALFGLGADLAGVRGAACEGGKRGARLSPWKARRVVEAFHAARRR
jgi:uncharacterized protein (UPF0264 family)